MAKLINYNHIEIVKKARVNDKVFYIGHWWEVIHKVDSIWRKIKPRVILRRHGKGKVYHLAV